MVFYTHFDSAAQYTLLQIHPSKPQHLTLTSETFSCLTIPFPFKYHTHTTLHLHPNYTLTQCLIYILYTHSHNTSPSSQIFARIDQLTTDDIKATARRFLADEDHVLAAIGTIGKLPNYDWIRERSCVY